ncbi:MAG: PIN/TRAM domain-containing protein [Pirellula sp.]
METPLQTSAGKRQASSPFADSIALTILRIIFIVAAASVGASLSQSPLFHITKLGEERTFVTPYLVFSSVLLAAFAVVAFDMCFPKKRIEIVSAIYFGLLVGAIFANLLTLAMAPLLANNPYSSYISLGVLTILCYACVSLLLQTKDDFRFVIPYVEFSRDLKGLKPLILDTSSVIDGRLAELAETNILDSRIVMPQFVLMELQAIADSSDKLRRVRGRRGLDILNRLRSSDKLDFMMYDSDLPEFAGQPVDMKLVLLAKHLDGKLVTGDFNLNKVAKLHNVVVIDLNQVASALRPQYLPGESFQIRIVKPGEGHEQGVGYLDDGTMVVIEGGRERINQTVQVAVTSTLQTQAGRMIFAKVDHQSAA